MSAIVMGVHQPPAATQSSVNPQELPQKLYLNLAVYHKTAVLTLEKDALFHI